MLRTSRPQRAVRAILVAAMSVGALTFMVVATASPVDAGQRNCTEMSGPGSDRAGCWEDVWAAGDEYRMTFATGCCTQFKGDIPADLDDFYVIAPQDDPPQSLDAAFRHDHVVRDIPRQNGGAYSVRLHGLFVICTESGITSGACVFEMNSPAPGLTLPFAKTVNGQSLTSAERIERAAEAGLVTFVDTGAVIVGTINQSR